jgi:hypothetical protein
LATFPKTTTKNFKKNYKKTFQNIQNKTPIANPTFSFFDTQVQNSAIGVFWHRIRVLIQHYSSSILRGLVLLLPAFLLCNCHGTGPMHRSSCPVLANRKLDLFLRNKVFLILIKKKRKRKINAIIPQQSKTLLWICDVE